MHPTDLSVSAPGAAFCCWFWMQKQNPRPKEFLCYEISFVSSCPKLHGVLQTGTKCCLLALANKLSAIYQYLPKDYLLEQVLHLVEKFFSDFVHSLSHGWCLCVEFWEWIVVSSVSVVLITIPKSSQKCPHHSCRQWVIKVTCRLRYLCILSQPAQVLNRAALLLSSRRYLVAQACR